MSMEPRSWQNPRLGRPPPGVILPIPQFDKSSSMTSNTALTDELEAVNSIYNADTLSVIAATEHSTSTVLNLPASPFSFNVTFHNTYPDVPPEINGTQSTGPNTKKGEGEAALSILRDVLGNIYTPGQVCLFDLIEEVTPLLQQSEPTPDTTTDHPSTSTSVALEASDHGSSQNHGPTPANRSATFTPTPLLPDLSTLHVKDLASDSSPASTLPEPKWSLSQPLLVNKSTFVARAVQANSLQDATSAISHLLSTNKKVAGATHNITAWRIKTRHTASDGKTSNGGVGSGTGPEITIQDCDDDGETAAGGRLLHLMQLMDVWNVVVVVTRWYGGVKLGADRFRCINMVARDALVSGGFAKEDPAAAGSKGKGKKK